jgi:hypothetical protein
MASQESAVRATRSSQPSSGGTVVTQSQKFSRIFPKFSPTISSPFN